MRRLCEILAAALVLLVAPVIAYHPLTWPLPAIGFATTAEAVQPDEILPDRDLEARARAISAGLRCLVCQNQSIDDSDAGLARDLRILVRERLRAGDDDDGVRDYVVARYGEFVLLKPRLTVSTVLLWGTPALLILLGGAYAYAAARRRQPPPSQQVLSEAEERAVERALADRGL